MKWNISQAWMNKKSNLNFKATFRNSIFITFEIFHNFTQQRHFEFVDAKQRVILLYSLMHCWKVTQASFCERLKLVRDTFNKKKDEALSFKTGGGLAICALERFETLSARRRRRRAHDALSTNYYRARTTFENATPKNVSFTRQSR